MLQFDVNWYETRFLVDPSPGTKEPFRDHCGELFRRTWMSTSSDNVPFSTTNWELENKRLLFLSPSLFSFLSPRERRISSSKNRAKGGCGMMPEQERATGYWTLQGQFSWTMSATLFTSVCVLLRKSRVTQVYPVSSAGAVYVKGIPACGRVPSTVFR